MKNEKIVIINGQKYDTSTGLPVAKSKPQPKPATIHSIAERSRDLYNRTTKLPVSATKSSIRKIGRSMDFARSKSIAHFAPHLAPNPSRPVKVKKQMDIGPTKHPLVTRIEKDRLISKSQAIMAYKSTKEIKEEVIAEALARTPVRAPKKKNFFKRHRKFVNVFTISFFLIIIALYFTYLNIPSLSVRIASAEAGINANYPEYHPDGYSPSGPVTFTDGAVSINFQANTGNTKFTIVQAKSSWDSSAVKNKVTKDTNGEFLTNEVRGLTIYTYGGNATWVNGGILYTIKGDAKLSADQISHIATSL